jgi:tRNA(adenine34) deaminase
MCAGGIVLARIPRLVYGARDPKAGACGSLSMVPQDLRLNHRAEVVSGVRADECSALLEEFFRTRRRALNNRLES